MKTIFEPFRIKVTEPLVDIPRNARVKALEKAHYNVFLLDSADCCIDLLTDSGTGAMSTQQWTAMMLGDESYAGSPSWKNFEKTVREITGMRHIFPTHQGRAAEGILASTLIKPGDVIPNNSHFDTTRANIEFVGGQAVNLLCKEGLDNSSEAHFKGNMDVEQLEKCIEDNGTERIPFCMLTITNNTGGGQPVSLANIKSVKNLLYKYDIPLILDACRFAENSYFIQLQEHGYQNRSLTEIAREIFEQADASTMSLKKDGLVNIGGFLTCQNDSWAENFKNSLILREGFPTYGGLAGRDLEAAAVGLREALQEDYQEYRHATIKYMAKGLDAIGIPYVKPVGGHAVFLDARAALPDTPPLAYPGIGLVNALYIEGGIRSVELGTVMFGSYSEDGTEIPSPLELVRLAFPRRVYTQSHFDYVLEVIESVWQQREEITGSKIEYQPAFLRHFSCHFSPIVNQD